MKDLAGTTRTQRVKFAVMALIIFVIAQLSHHIVYAFEGYKAFVAGWPPTAQRLHQPVRWLVLCWLGLFLAHRLAPWRAFREMGMAAHIGVGAAFGFVASVPMLLPAALLGKLAEDISWPGVFFGAAIWPLAEEMLYRGYAFRQLHRRAGWNLWVAAVVTGLAFGAVHLGNASVQCLGIGAQIGTAAIISAGGIFYAWIFACWNDNLWVPWVLHGLMNLWWGLFDLADNPLGGWLANLMRAGTIAAAIVITIFFASGGLRRRAQAARAADERAAEITPKRRG